jgi:hypothetical protein
VTFQPLRTFLVLACSVACMCLATQSFALEGKVIDGSTGKPLAGVYVIGAWVVSSGIGVVAKSGCGKLEVTRTDEQGRFTLSKWSGSILAHLIGDENLNAYYYMRGYRWEKGHPQIGETVVLVPDTRPPIERVRYIGELTAKADCGPWEEQKLKALAMYRSMYEDARSITSSSYEDRQALSGILFMVERLDLGEEQAQANARMRLNRGYR